MADMTDEERAAELAALEAERWAEYYAEIGAGLRGDADRYDRATLDG